MRLASVNFENFLGVRLGQIDETDRRAISRLLEEAGAEAVRTSTLVQTDALIREVGTPRPGSQTEPQQALVSSIIVSADTEPVRNGPNPSPSLIEGEPDTDQFVWASLPQDIGNEQTGQHVHEQINPDTYPEIQPEMFPDVYSYHDFYAETVTEIGLEIIPETDEETGKEIKDGIDALDSEQLGQGNDLETGPQPHRNMRQSTGNQLGHQGRQQIDLQNSQQPGGRTGPQTSQDQGQNWWNDVDNWEYWR
jgi:hypothetical protein